MQTRKRKAEIESDARREARLSNTVVEATQPYHAAWGHILSWLPRNAQAMLRSACRFFGRLCVRSPFQKQQQHVQVLLYGENDNDLHEAKYRLFGARRRLDNESNEELLRSNQWGQMLHISVKRTKQLPRHEFQGCSKVTLWVTRAVPTSMIVHWVSQFAWLGTITDFGIGSAILSNLGLRGSQTTHVPLPSNLLSKCKWKAFRDLQTFRWHNSFPITQPLKTYATTEWILPGLEGKHVMTVDPIWSDGWEDVDDPAGPPDPEDGYTFTVVHEVELQWLFRKVAECILQQKPRLYNDQLHSWFHSLVATRQINDDQLAFHLYGWWSIWSRCTCALCHQHFHPMIGVYLTCNTMEAMLIYCNDQTVSVAFKDEIEELLTSIPAEQATTLVLR
jgi:hypothetical protein